MIISKLMFAAGSIIILLVMTSHSIETASALLSALPFGRSALRAGSALVEEGLACARDWDPVSCQALSHDGVRTVPMLLLWTVLVVYLCGSWWAKLDSTGSRLNQVVKILGGTGTLLFYGTISCKLLGVVSGVLVGLIPLFMVLGSRGVNGVRASMGLLLFWTVYTMQRGLLVFWAIFGIPLFMLYGFEDVGFRIGT